MKAVAEQFGANSVRRNRLLFRCWHRGTQEGDLILGPFAEMFLAGFDSGGTRTNISVRRSCCSPTAGLPTAAINAPESASLSLPHDHELHRSARGPVSPLDLAPVDAVLQHQVERAARKVVRDQVRDRLDFIFEDLGEQSVKNIARPMRQTMV